MAKESSIRSMEWNRAHQSVVNARIAKIKKDNPEKYKAIDREYRKKNREAIDQRIADYRAAHPEKVKEWSDRYRAKPKSKADQARRGHLHYQKLRHAVLQGYGGLIPHCACCGDGHEEFLTIDHMNGDGAKQRREGMRGIAFYIWLIKNDFPQGFRVLCMNCNFSLGMRGYCPHNGPGG